MTVAEGASLGRYTVVAPLGSGAMGEVYRARDDVLQRDVAIKILPEARWDDPRRRARFEREARALARISHPNILAIHDFGTDDGVSYAVTELLEGENLRQRIHSGALAWDEAVQITARVADGLAAAHEQGIIHRDLKPENIFLTSEGGVKILDFGIARVVETDSRVSGSGPRAPTTALTRPDMVMGTVGYMSPEQVAGNTVDGRSDIFSLGCVLYEAVSGEQPFLRETDAETMFSILREEPLDLISIGTNAPAGVQRILDRCLEKEPASRYSTADDLAVDLRSLPTGQAAVGLGLFSRMRLRLPRKRSLLWGVAVAAVAILLTLGALQVPRWLAGATTSAVDARSVRVDAFENRTGDPTLDPLGAAAADRISDALLRSGMVGVASATGAEPEINEAGVEGLPLLGSLEQGAAASTAGTVVDGEYFLRDDTVEIHARVRDRVRGELAHVIEPVRGTREDTAALTDELSGRIRDAVLWHLHPRAEFGASGEPPSFAAYREYTIGMELNDSQSEEAHDHLDRAAELDAEFLEPRVWLMHSYWSMCVHPSGTSVCERFEELLGELAAEPERFSTLGRILLRGYNARLGGHSLKAYRVLRDALQLAPDDPGIHWLVADAAYRARRYGDAIAILEDCPNEGPESAWRAMSRINLLLDSYHMEGDYLAELDLASTAARMYFDDGFVRRRLARSLAALGRVDEVDAILDETFAVDNVLNLVDLLLVTGKELRVHGWREPTVRVGERWLAWLDAQQSNPDFNAEHPLWRTCRARALGLAERWGEARVIWEDLFEEDPKNDSIGKLFSLGPSTYLQGIAKTAAREGDRETALEVQKLLTEGRGDRFAYGAYTLLGAKIAALLGDRDRALALVRQSLAEGYPKPNNLHWLLSADAIRNDGELRELLHPRD